MDCLKVICDVILASVIVVCFWLLVCGGAILVTKFHARYWNTLHPYKTLKKMEASYESAVFRQTELQDTWCRRYTEQRSLAARRLDIITELEAELNQKESNRGRHTKA